MIRQGSPGRHDTRDGSRTYSPRYRLVYFSDLPKNMSLRDHVRVRPELKILTGEVFTGKIDGDYEVSQKKLFITIA